MLPKTLPCVISYIVNYRFIFISELLKNITQYFMAITVPWSYKFFWHKTKQKISLLIWLKSWRNDKVVETRLHIKSYHDFTFIPMLFCPKLFLIIVLIAKVLPKTLFWVCLNLVDVKTWKKIILYWYFVIFSWSLLDSAHPPEHYELWLFVDMFNVNNCS